MSGLSSEPDTVCNPYPSIHLHSSSPTTSLLRSSAIYARTAEKQHLRYPCHWNEDSASFDEAGLGLGASIIREATFTDCPGSSSEPRRGIPTLVKISAKDMMLRETKMSFADIFEVSTMPSDFKVNISWRLPVLV